MEKKPGRSIQEKNAQKRTRLDLDGLPEADIKSKLRNYFGLWDRDLFIINCHLEYVIICRKS